MADESKDNAGVVAPPPLIYLGFLATGLLLKKAPPARFLPHNASRLIGGSLLAAGLLLGGWFQRALRRAGTPVNPQKPVSSLVSDGPFRYSRNPGYLSLAMMYGGIASLANAFWAILLLPAALLTIRRGVIEREERYLEGKFGAEYRRYKVQVPRWF
ncbi:MAG: isoprenylcysteine carboxylmethyltransferase family protein [Rubrobacteraceae bacterium]